MLLLYVLEGKIRVEGVDLPRTYGGAGEAGTVILYWSVVWTSAVRIGCPKKYSTLDRVNAV
jgi:hypothetical protein